MVCYAQIIEQLFLKSKNVRNNLTGHSFRAGLKTEDGSVGRIKPQRWAEAEAPLQCFPVPFALLCGLACVFAFQMDCA
jgi:hypothetical protein